MFRLEPVESIEEFVLAYIQQAARASTRLLADAPPGFPSYEDGAGIVRYVAEGERGEHEIVVRLEPGEHGILATVRPAYPLYLLATAAPWTALLTPALIARRGETVLLVLADSVERALALLIEALAREPLVDPVALDPEQSGTSFEGWLYELPPGRIAFASQQAELEHVDFILGHRGEDTGEAVYPEELFEAYAALLAEKLSTAEDKEEKEG